MRHKSFNKVITSKPIVRDGLAIPKHMEGLITSIDDDRYVVEFKVFRGDPITVSLYDHELEASNA